MRTKLITILSLLFLSIIAAKSQERVTLNFFKNEEMRGVIINGAFDIQLSQGENMGASVEIYSDLADKLSVLIDENKNLVLSYSNNVTKYLRGKKKPLAKIVVSQLENLDISGNVSVIAKGYFTAYGTFRLAMSGVAQADFLKVTCYDADMFFSGNSNITDSEIKAKDEVTLKASGSSSSSLRVDCDNLMVIASGTAKATVSGEATKSTTVNSSSTSKIVILDFRTPQMTAVLSGMSVIEANVTGRVTLTKSKMSSFRYIGSGNITGDEGKPM